MITIVIEWTEIIAVAVACFAWVLIKHLIMSDKEETK